jgi:hypothetical protein
MGAAVESLRFIALGGTQTPAAPLDPKFAYLRVTRGSHVGMLWRGSMEASPAGPVEVYYSSTGEVVRLRDGRLLGALGLATEWRQVTIAAPAWTAAAKSAEVVPVVRTRDVMPGYRSGVRDELSLRVVPPPARSALHGVDPRSLTWFEEGTHSASFRLPGTASDELPPTRYAVDFTGGKEAVVYAEQCLARDLCFTWQRWSAALQQAITAPSR